MVGWHHRLSGHEFEQAPGVGEEGKPRVLQAPEGCTCCGPLVILAGSHACAFSCLKKVRQELVLGCPVRGAGRAGRKKDNKEKIF